MIAALTFLTVIGRGGRPDGQAMRWFPLVGALVGAVVGGVWWAAFEVLPVGPAAVVVVAADLALTGMLHLDGLADSADGLLPHLSRDRRLAVMAAPDVGAFGVGVVVLVLTGRVTAFASQPSSWLLIVALWALSRSMMALIATTQPYARSEGLASAFLGDRAAPACAVGGVAAAFVVAGVATGWRGVGAGGAALLSIALVVALARRRLGGFTGDVLGAAGLVGETTGLIVASGRW